MGCTASQPAQPAAAESWQTPAKQAAQPQPIKGAESATAQEDRGTIKAVPASTAPPPAAAPAAPAAAAPSPEAAAKSKKSRARRLSYVVPGATDDNADDGSAPGTEKADGEGAEGDETAAQAQAKKNTRARRLSYVTDSSNMQKLEQAGEASPDELAPEDVPEQTAAMVIKEAKAPKAPIANGKQITCTLSCMSRAGREPGFKKQNQDNCFAFEKYVAAGQALFGAFDGHGPNGHLVSGYVKQHLPILLVNHLSEGEDVGTGLSNGFLEVDKSLGTTRIDCEFSGSTAVVSLLRGATLTTAWVGDSRCVLGRKVEGPRNLHEAVALTKDHKPTVPEEKQRILDADGRVERLVDEMGQPIGPYRVWLQRTWVPGLAMSRALGDKLAHRVGVTTQPEVKVVELTPNDAFIVLASDGVWEFISNQEVVDIIADARTVEEGCRALVDEAHHRWLVEEEGVVDDITAVVVMFNHGA